MKGIERLPFRKGLGSAAAIFDARQRILLVKHTYGRLNWELPGGFVEPQEVHAPASADEAETSECRFWPIAELPRPISDFTIRRIHDASSGSSLPMPAIVGPRLWLE